MHPSGTAAPNDVAFWETQDQDQKATSSETACYVQPALVFNWGLAGPIPVGICLLEDMRGFSRFVIIGIRL
jgi:hypothetical protein